jgi:hypothetical protein
LPAFKKKQIFRLFEKIKKTRKHIGFRASHFVLTGKNEITPGQILHHYNNQRRGGGGTVPSSLYKKEVQSRFFRIPDSPP